MPLEDDIASSLGTNSEEGEQEVFYISETPRTIVNAK